MILCIIYLFWSLLNCKSIISQEGSILVADCMFKMHMDSLDCLILHTGDFNTKKIISVWEKSIMKYKYTY